MYLAELHGKLPSWLERSEDILTSNVFSFFKYSTRRFFLKALLEELRLDVSCEEVDEAEFLFWPRFEENTEPDLVMIVGDYYLLVEAKYFSGFGQGSEKTEAQLLREIKGGTLEAKNYGKRFRLVVITADYCRKEEKFHAIPSELSRDLSWVNWQSIGAVLNGVLESGEVIRKEEREFATDLCSLLARKNLRGFHGFDVIHGRGRCLRSHGRLFFDAGGARFRGAFIGFLESLSVEKRMKPFGATIFWREQEQAFLRLPGVGKLNAVGNLIFYKGVMS